MKSNILKDVQLNKESFQTLSLDLFKKLLKYFVLEQKYKIKFKIMAAQSFTARPTCLRKKLNIFFTCFPESVLIMNFIILCNINPVLNIMQH